jgi:hypothetical protein
VNDNLNTSTEYSLQHVQKLEEERAANKVSVNNERLVGLLGDGIERSGKSKRLKIE